MNKRDNIEKALIRQTDEVFENLESKGFVVNKDYFFSGTYLQGRQNYNAAYARSDVESKVALTPSIDSLIKGVDFNFDFTTSQNEKVSVKTPIEYSNLFFKGDINNLEILTTKYFLPSSFFEKLKKQCFLDDLVAATSGEIWNACVEMMIQKNKSLLKPTEGTKEFFDEHGYNNKDAAHIFRIAGLLESLQEGKAFEICLDVTKTKKFHWFISARDGFLTKDEIISSIDEVITSFREKTPPFSNDKEMIEKLKKEVMENYVEFVKTTNDIR